MKEHLSTEIVERFYQQALAQGERALVYDHVLKCETCRQQIVDPGIEALALQTLSLDLTSDSGSDPHLDYGTLESYVVDRLDKDERNEVERHLLVCADCSSEVTDLHESLATMSTAFIRQKETETSLRDRIGGLTRFQTSARPLQISAVIVFIVIALIAGVLVWRLRSDRPTQEPLGGRDLTAGSKPTPVQSPFDAQPDSSPFPTPGPGQNNTTEPAPEKKPPQLARELVALNDGPYKITLEKSAKLTGLESLPRETQQAVVATLIAQTIKKPEVLDQLDVPEVSLRAPSGNDEQVRIVYPTNTVIAEDRPLFEWVPSRAATAYRVEIGDANFHQVAKSEDLPPASRSWIPPTPLRRGGVYTWVVRSIHGGPEVESTSQGKFKVLDDEKMKELIRLQRVTQSRLVLGVFYARAGMVAEAEREFQILARENPRSAVTRSLLRQVQSWGRY